MDCLIENLAYEIERMLSPEKAQLFMQLVNSKQFRKAYLVLEQLKNMNTVSKTTVSEIEEFWWNYAN
jgi:hypothetical protein